MPINFRRRFDRPAVLGIALLAVLSAAATLPAQTPAATRALPERLTDAEFWKLVTDISEPDAYFRIVDNYTSNEMEVGRMFSWLRAGRFEGDVYLGVGPEQNFSYIAAIKPKMAFICDIRRQAAMQHLMYKVIFEMSRDRAEFLSILFGRPRPGGLDSNSTIAMIWNAYGAAQSDTVLRNANHARVLERITRTHGFTLTPIETDQLKSVFYAFHAYGPAITTQGSNTGRGNSATFIGLTGFSTDSVGQPRSFLTSEENYVYIKTLHEKNLIVPVTGDFGGSKAMRKIGEYLKEHGGTVRAFYVSNVEQYLFTDGKNRAFYDNVAALPLDSTSVFIRPYSMRRNGTPTQALCSITVFLRSVAAGRVNTNNDALACPM